MAVVKNKLIVKGPDGSVIGTSNEVTSNLVNGQVNVTKEQAFEEFFVDGHQEYSGTIKNTLALPLATCTIEDDLDDSIVYVAGTFKFDGVPVIPVYDVVTNKLSYTFLAWLPGVSHTVSFHVKAKPED